MAASAQPGMGAIPYAGGVAFRVWAPFAAAAYVAGDFNGWAVPPAPAVIPLTLEGNGYWSTDVPGVAAGAQYRFVSENGGPVWRIDPYARHVTNSAGNAVVLDPGFAWGPGGFQMPGWNELVIYELHVGTFNDHVVGAPGTFDTAIAQLPYLHDLGVNAVEVMPIAEFAGDLSMGYDPADPFAVESSYGGTDGFRRFVRAAHGLGIAVIVDVVYNHFGPADLGSSLWDFDGWQQNGMGGIYFYEDWRSWTPWGAKNRPDYGRGEVRQYLRDNALMWLQDYQADGLRMDATAYVRNVYGNNNDPAHDLAEGWNLLRWINDEILARQPWKITIAEDLKGNAWITNSTGAGGAGFGSQWDVSFADTVRAAVVAVNDADRDVGAVAAALANSGGSAAARVVYTESHDEADKGHERLPLAICQPDPTGWYARKRSTLAAALVFTAPGIPMLLQGQEFLSQGYFDDADPVDWTLLPRFGGIHDLYRDLIRLRRNWFDNTRGLRGTGVHVFQAGPQDKVIAFHRWDQGGPGDDVIVVANLSCVSYPSYTIGFPRTGTWWVRFNSDYAGYSPDFANTPGYDTAANGSPCQNMPYSGNVGIGPYSVLILSQ